MNLVIKSQLENMFDGDCAVKDQPFVPNATCGIDLSTVLDIDSSDGTNADIGTVEPVIEFGRPIQDWFEMALKADTPIKGSVRASWGEDEDEMRREERERETERWKGGGLE